MEWDEAAENRLSRIPYFLRAMVKKGVERHARENNVSIITIELMEELRQKRFGNEKTIQIHISGKNNMLHEMLSGIPDCKIEFKTDTIITIQSSKSEVVLMDILKILNQHNIAIEDLSAMPTNLEEIFLKVVSDSDASNN
mgnify:CR=1 FL=1